MSLLADVVSLLAAEEIPHALIGAAAMAVHGVSRATTDVDLLTVDRRALEAGLWSGFEVRGVSLRVLKGDADDPLAGSVRISTGGDAIVDVVVGRWAWQREIIDAAAPMSIGEVTVKVARPAGLVLLKLYAGGPKDAWDIRSLLESHDEAGAVEAEVNDVLPRLPAECRQLWDRVRKA